MILNDSVIQKFHQYYIFRLYDSIEIIFDYIIILYDLVTLKSNDSFEWHDVLINNRYKIKGEYDL